MQQPNNDVSQINEPVVKLAPFSHTKWWSLSFKLPKKRPSLLAQKFHIERKEKRMKVARLCAEFICDKRCKIYESSHLVFKLLFRLVVRAVWHQKSRLAFHKRFSGMRNFVNSSELFWYLATSNTRRSVSGKKYEGLVHYQCKLLYHLLSSLTFRTTQICFRSHLPAAFQMRRTTLNVYRHCLLSKKRAMQYL